MMLALAKEDASSLKENGEAEREVFACDQIRKVRMKRTTTKNWRQQAHTSWVYILKGKSFVVKTWCCWLCDKEEVRVSTSSFSASLHTELSKRIENNHLHSNKTVFLFILSLLSSLFYLCSFHVGLPSSCCASFCSFSLALPTACDYMLRKICVMVPLFYTPFRSECKRALQEIRGLLVIQSCCLLSKKSKIKMAPIKKKKLFLKTGVIISPFQTFFDCHPI